MSVSLFALEIELRVGPSDGQNLVRQLFTMLTIDEAKQDGAGLGDLVEQVALELWVKTRVVSDDNEPQPLRCGESHRPGVGVDLYRQFRSESETKQFRSFHV